MPTPQPRNLFQRINLPELNGRTYEELLDLNDRLFHHNENDYRIWSEKMKHKIIGFVLFAVILFLKYGIYFVS